MLQKLRIPALFITIGILLMSINTIALACGGFFCTNVPIDQNAERIIFTVNDDNTVTAVVGITYVGNAEDFSWIVPVPSPPELDVAETRSLDALQLATDIRFIEPISYCSDLIAFDGRGGGGGMEVILGSVGPYNYAILTSDNPDELITWLIDNGYTVTDDMKPIINQYVDEGFYFLAMRLNQDATVGDIQPIVMTYEAESPMIPIRLTAVAAVDDMPVITWIFGDTRYEAANYANPTVDYSDWQATNRISILGDWEANIGISFVDDFIGFIPDTILRYQAEQKEIQEDYEGLAFITEFAGKSDLLIDQIPEDDAFLLELIDRYPYMTRLRAQMSPDQMTLDPYFVPADSMEDVSNQVNLSNYVNVMDYWGCSTRNILSNTTLDNLPTGHTYFEDWQLDFAHPEDWVITELTINNTVIRVAATETVTEEQFLERINDENDIEMFAMVTIDGGYFTGANPGFYLERILDLEERPNVPETSANNSNGRLHPFQIEYDAKGVLFLMLATDQEWEESGDLYQAMLDYANGYQYYLHRDLRHTLMLGQWFSQGTSKVTYRPVMLSFPDGWMETLDEDELVIVIPESDAEGDPKAKIYPLGIFKGDDIIPFPNVQEAYGLAEELSPFTDLIPFAINGREGYIRVDDQYLIEVSTAEGTLEQWDESLQMIAESLTFVRPEWDEVYESAAG